MNPTGTLYGVGVGPGDPELITQKAVRIIRQCPVIAAPQTGQARQVAFGIASQAVENLDQKTILALPFPMVKDAEVLSKTRDELAAMLENPLREGKDVAFLTLGDPTIYSTYWYLHQRSNRKGSHAVYPRRAFLLRGGRLFGSGPRGSRRTPARPARFLCRNRRGAGPAGNQSTHENGAFPGRKPGKPYANRGCFRGPCWYKLRPSRGTHLPGLGKRTARSQLLFDDCDKGGASMIHFVGAGPGAPVSLPCGATGFCAKRTSLSMRDRWSTPRCWMRQRKAVPSTTVPA